MNDFAFGNFICALRTEKGLSQSELGTLLGVSNKAVSKWETGAAKPRVETLGKLAGILGVTVPELLCGKRMERDGAEEEIAVALDILSREYRRARAWMLACCIVFFASPPCMAIIMGIAYAADALEWAWLLVPLAVLAVLHIVGEVGVIAFCILTAKRKRVLYASFPNRAEAISARTHTVPPAKKTGKLGLVVICGVLLMLLAVALILGSLHVCSPLAAELTVICGSLAVGVCNIVFQTLWMRRIRKEIAAGKPEQAIKDGKFLLEVWLPDGRSVLCDTLRLQIAVAYFSLYDDENFRAYLSEITTKKALAAKSYWKCIDAAIGGDLAAFRLEYETVFLPLVGRGGSGTKRVTEFYRKPLSLLSSLLDGTAPADAKPLLESLVSNPRVRAFIETL